MRKRTLTRMAALALFIACIFATEIEIRAQLSLFQWSVSEFQPDIPNGGRANTIAVHPTDANKIYVTSETGGLFRSTDRGAHWKHVDALPCFRTVSVVYLPANPNIVLVTTTDDFGVTSSGGVWRSTDGGFNWSLVPVTIPASIFNGRLSGYEISVAPDTGDIYVGTEYGALKSTTQGASWVFQDVFGGGDRRTFSVAALGGNRALAAGPAGVRRTDTGGTGWLAPTTGAGGIYDVHALGRSPLSNTQAFVVNGATNLFHTEDGGQTWTQVMSAPGGGGGCGGITFARAVDRSARVGFILRRRFDLFFGNRCGVSKLRVPRNLLTGVFNYSGAWQNLGIDHSDTRDIAFDNSRLPVPLLLATDGGLHKTIDAGANWTFTGGGKNGYNALQITEVQGQLIQDIGRYDFYFGTQDNDLWSSGTDGSTWSKGTCCEGFFIEMQKKVATTSDSKVTFVACGACVNLVSDALFSNVALWSNPAGDIAGNPVIIRKSQHIQGVNTSGGFTRGFSNTGNLGGAWSQYVTFPEDRRDIAKLGRVGSFLPRRSTVVYQAYRAPGWAGFEINWLMRINKNPRNATATVVYPAMNNFGGLGINPTMFAWYQVYAVDPGNYLHVIAPDVVNQRVMETRDGGENWMEIAGLANLVTDSGRLRFNVSIFPLVSAIGFSPQNPNLVAIGTFDGGVFISSDNGTNWSRVNNSDGVTYATRFAWKSASDVVISTYGRGLWRMKSRLIIRIPDWERWCRLPCMIRIWPWERVFDPLTPVEFDRGVLVYEGKILGASIVNQVVKEIFVSEGSSVVFVGDNWDSQDIKITYAKKFVGFRGSRYSAQAPREAQLMKGLVFDKENRLKGAVFGDKEMTMFEEADIDDREGNTKSPAADKPYIRIVTKRFDGAPTAAPGEVIAVTVANFRRDTDAVVYVDDKPVSKVRVDRQGNSKTEIRAPVEFGLHSITIRYANDEKKVIDGTMFFVKHIDDFKKGRRPPK